jgi:hypothetical protein
MSITTAIQPRHTGRVKLLALVLALLAYASIQWGSAASGQSPAATGLALSSGLYRLEPQQVAHVRLVETDEDAEPAAVRIRFLGSNGKVLATFDRELSVDHAVEVSLKHKQLGRRLGLSFRLVVEIARPATPGTSAPILTAEVIDPGEGCGGVIPPCTVPFVEDPAHSSPVPNCPGWSAESLASGP